MDGKLFFRAITRFAAGVLAMGLLLFLPAGTLGWRNGWLLMGILFLPMFVAGLWMLRGNPELLRRRLNAKEAEPAQRRVVAASALMFAAAFVVAGLTHRFGWLSFPGWVSFAGAALFLIAYLLYAEVLRENAWLSRTVEVSEGQRVVDTGFYGVVRHPMYAVTLMLFLSMPLVLGSPLSLLILLIYPVIIVRRILNEEDVLRRELDGYEAYTRRVKYRLIPHVW